MEMTDEETGEEWPLIGVHTLPPLSIPEDPENAVETIRKAALDALKTGRRLLALGGDHAVTIGCVAAAKELFPGLGVLQIDAHADLRDTWNGSRCNHACVMRRVVEDMGLPVVQAGIRSCSPEEARFMAARGLRPFFAHETAGKNPEWMDRAIALLPETVYLTVDLDGLDPSVVPGTGTPEPGGYSYREAVELVRRLGAARRVVAADVNELAAFPGSRVSEYTAARVAQKIITHVFG
jgi:agmatinase